MRRNPMMIEVSDKNEGKVIGHVEPKTFMDWCHANGARTDQFLATLVDQFNAGKERMGEPERVRIVLRKAA